MQLQPKHTVFYSIFAFTLGVVFVGTGFAVHSLSADKPSVDSQPATVVQSVDTPVTATPPLDTREQFIEIIDSCNPYFVGKCAQAYAEPHASSTSLVDLRNGVVLKVGGLLYNENDMWYEVVFDEWLRYPGRLPEKMYVRAENTRAFKDVGNQELGNGASVATTTKRIVIDRSEQTLYAYEGDDLVLTEPISTGILKTPTPRGTFEVYKKTPSRYMQGPLPNISDKYYDLPGVPWNLYFTLQGGVIHGTYWHDKFGQAWSNGCVNVVPSRAEALYYWADLGTPVVVHD